MVPAGDLPWPVSLQDDSKPDLWATYGQYSDAGFLHFHEGIDLAAPKDTPVTAIALGAVFNDPTAGADPYRHLTVDAGGNEGWTYLHIVPGVNKDTGMAFAKGDTVTATNKSPIGKVVDFGGGQPNHLHLGYGKGVDPYITDSFMPSADPLEFLEARPDKTTPVVEGIFFRFGTNDAAGDSSGKLSAGVLRPSGNRIEQSETYPTTH